MSTSDIAKIIESTFKEHRASRDKLAAAIVKMLDLIPNGTTLKTASHTVEIRKVFCGCSQWSNRSWDVTGSSRATLVDGNLIQDEYPTVFDGNNFHDRRTPLYLSPDGDSSALKLAAATTLRSLARELPDSIKSYIDGKREDTKKNELAIEELNKS